MSKEESSQAPSKAPEPEEHEVAEAGTAVEERQEIHPPSSPKPLPEQSDGSGCSPIIGSIGAPVRASSLALEKPSIALSEEEEAAEHTPDPTPPLAVADCTETKQPMPSTSAGKTAKRIRKTVMFKEGKMFSLSYIVILLMHATNILRVSYISLKSLSGLQLSSSHKSGL